VLDVERWRAETPGCTRCTHFNNAGAALMPRPVLDAVESHLALEEHYGGYEAAELQSDAIAEVYTDVALLIGAHARNIALVENATVAASQALLAIDFHPGDRIVTTRNDYVAHQLHFLALRRRLDIRIDLAPDLPEGGVDPDGLRRLAAHPRCRLVTATWLPTNSGLVQDVRAIGLVCEQLGVPFLLDACQAVGQVPIDVTELRCDFLSATARKFLRGPRGIGFLYVADRVLERGWFPLTIDARGATWTGPDTFLLGDSARRFENWEFAYALVLGLGAAARYAHRVGIAAGGRRARTLAATVRARVLQLPTARLLDRGRELSAIVTFVLDRTDSREIVRQLRARGINTSATLREWAVLDMGAKGVESAVRVSPHYYNEEVELDALMRALAELATY